LSRAVPERGRKIRITYLFRGGRRARLATVGETPTEFFYGYPQLKAKGLDVRFIEDQDVGLGPPLPLVARFVDKVTRAFGGMPVGMTMSLAMAGGGRRLEQAGIVVATTNNIGLSLALGKAVGLVRVPVLLLAMGLLVKRPGWVQEAIYGVLMRRLHVACISKAEQAFLSRCFPERPVQYLPFGVDAGFWCPGLPSRNNGGYVLAIGNDLHRDWKTLVAAWSGDLPRLKIVTSLAVPPAPANVEVIRGDWRSQLVSDADIRDLYRGADFVIIPLRDTIQPSGQSACLQAMACGKAVILSDIAGLWSRELMIDNEAVVLTPPGDAAALAERARKLMNVPGLTRRLGEAARRVVENHLNAERMADALLEMVERIHD